MRNLLLTMSALGMLALAQDPGEQAVDPPSRAARLSYLTGSVSFQPGGVEDWVPAEMNRPLTTGDRLWTEDGSRAEMHLGSAAFRLNGRTNVSFLNLDDRTAQVQLSLGTMSVHIRKLNEDETFEIDTPQAAFTLLRPGEYRVEVSEQGDATIVTVHGGDIEATAGGQAFPIHAREQVRISGGGEGAPPAFDRRTAPISDPFDLFCQDRDRREDFSQSARYVSREMPGYSDLDANGTWRQDPQYGAVWVPSGVVVGWSPYHYGHWAWIAPWGWTWIDDAPWGYAPFHYGRWAFVAGAWGWIPGPVAVRPVYAPAMVAWVGGGGFAASLSIGGGVAVGWFPLGPREVWVPSYHVSAVYMTRVNVSNTVVTEVNVRNVYTNVYVNHTTVVNNVYVNQHVTGAVVAVPGGAIVAGRSVAAVAVRVPPAAVVNVTVVHNAPVAPERAAVLGGRPPVVGVAHVPPAAAMNRPVVAKMAPPPPPVAFAHQQEALRANPGRPLDAGQMRNFQANQSVSHPNVRPAGPSGFTPAPSNAGPRNFTPQNANANNSGAPNTNNSQPGSGQPRNFPPQNTNPGINRNAGQNAGGAPSNNTPQNNGQNNQPNGQPRNFNRGNNPPPVNTNTPSNTSSPSNSSQSNTPSQPVRPPQPVHPQATPATTSTPHNPPAANTPPPAQHEQKAEHHEQKPQEKPKPEKRTEKEKN